jgi:hypothetical protein
MFLQKDKKVVIRFHFDNEQRKKRLTWDDLETIELMQEGETSPRRLKALAAKFMVDEKGEFLSDDKAIKILGALKEEEIVEVMSQFAEALNGAAIKKENGSGSSSPSAAGPVETLPDGSAP